MGTRANGSPLDFANKKRKRSRWNQDTVEQKTVIPGMPTIIPPGLTREQEKAYIVQLQIENLTRKLRTGDLGIPPNPEDRSPSPEPIYNSKGKRLNTREFRTRKKLEEERHNLITEMLTLNGDFRPPADYKPPATRVSDKVMIPKDEYPEINFLGLLFGPRGHTLKNIEKQCNAKIMIRGKGSVKEGKVGRKDRQMLPEEDEPLHALVAANTMENVKKAVEQIRNILKQGIETPEDQNDLRKMQLRELAHLNGTLREDDNKNLRPWHSSETRSITNATVCTKCGGVGHIASDCKFQRPGDPQSAQDKARMDKEYLSLMAELGEAPVPASAGSASGPAATPLGSTPRPAAPANNPPPQSLMFTTQSYPPWMNSGLSENRPYHEMHGGGLGGPGSGPHNFPHLLTSLTGGHGGHVMQHNPNGPPQPLDAATTTTDEAGAPPTWATWPSSYGSVPGKYSGGLWGLQPTSRKWFSHDAAPTPSLWPSFPMAAIEASAFPTAQQQYSFQYPLAMAAKYDNYHHARWCMVDPAMATARGSYHSFSRSLSNERQPHCGAPRGPAPSAALTLPSPPPSPPPPPPPPLVSSSLMYTPPPPPSPMDPSNFVTKKGMGVSAMPPFEMPPAPPPPPSQN